MVTLNGANTGNVYNFKGLFKNLILTASYTSNAKGALDRGTITLMLVNNGSTLKGYCSFYEDSSSQVISTEYVLNRNTGET